MEGIEIMYLVTEGKRKENQLGYAPKTKEYVYFHHGKEIWREKGDKELLDYFNEVRVGIRTFNDKEIENNFIWKKYCKDCQSYERGELLKRR
jgi:hypothetical protein